MDLRILSEPPPGNVWQHKFSTRPAGSRAPGIFYDACRVLWNGVFGMTMRIRHSGIETIPGEGGLLIAVSHLGHLDPIVVSALFGRRIAWVSRAEGYRNWFMRIVLHHGGAFQVNRDGPALPTIREGLRRLARGEAVGIFPEGELMRGKNSVLRGAAIRQGVCLLANRSGKPILPVIVLGTNRLEEITPWLPAKRGRLWVLVGRPIHIAHEKSSRNTRAEASRLLTEEYVRMYAEIRETYGLREDIAP